MFLVVKLVCIGMYFCTVFVITPNAPPVSLKPRWQCSKLTVGPLVLVLPPSQGTTLPHSLEDLDGLRIFSISDYVVTHPFLQKVRLDN